MLYDSFFLAAGNSTASASVSENVQIWTNIMISIFTGILTLIAYYTLRSSFQGPSISLISSDHRDEKVMRTTEQFSETISFGFPLVISNSGPRGGAVVGFDVAMLVPPSTFLTGSTGVDNISCNWEIGKSLIQPEFRKGRNGSLSVRNNESIGLIARIHLTLQAQNSTVNSPTSNFVSVQARHPNFEFDITYEFTSGKGKIESKKKKITIRPIF